MANILRRSLKARVFVIFLLVSIAAVSILGAVSYFAGRAALRHAISESYTNITSVTESAVGQFLDASHVEFALVAGDYHIADLTEKIVKKDPDSAALLKELIAYGKGFLTANPDTAEFFILDMSGEIIASTQEKQMGIDESNDEYFTKGQKEVYIKDVYKSNTTGEIGFVISGPLVAVHSKELLGVFCIRYDMKGINAITADRTGMGKTGETYIVNRDGTRITESRFDKDSVLKQKVESEPVRLWRSQKKDMTGQYADYHGQMTLGASMGEDLLKKHPELGWLVLSEIDADEAFAPVQKLGLAILVLGIIISIVVATIAYLIAQNIANPIGKIAAIVQKVGEGDLTQDVPESNAQDEIGILSKSFRATVISLRNIVSQVIHSAERVSSSSQELSSTAQEMNATTEEVSSTIQQIAKGTETQAQKVEETQKVMEQMSASVSQVSKSAQAAAGQGSRAADAAQKGGEAVKQTRRKIEEVFNAIVSSNDMIKKLGQRSDQIGDIVDVITNIADQTNLLALNAAIEAARAGEYGRGFAVVAEEVRKLAEASAKSADEIARLIRDIQKETVQAVSNMEESSKGAGDVRDMSGKVAEALDAIIKNTESVATMIEQVSAASQQQAAGTAQVSKSVGDIASVAEESASATQEASASTEEMTASMEEMAASAQELADMGMTLWDLVSKFKTGEGASIVDSRKSIEKESTKAAKTEVGARMSVLRERAEEARVKMETLRKTRIAPDKKKDADRC